MKKKKIKECKIIENLLPNYIDELTDKDINEYIEEHIATCPECAQKLADMSGEFKLEQINREKEVKQLKRLRRKILTVIISCIIAVIILAAIICTGIVIYNNYKNRIQVSNYTFMQVDYILEDREGAKDGNIYGSMIIAFDEKNVCKSIRVVQKGYEENYLEEKNMKESLYQIKAWSNYKIINNEEHFNMNMWNGLEKQYIINNCLERYNVLSFLEL